MSAPNVIAWEPGDTLPDEPSVVITNIGMFPLESGWNQHRWVFFSEEPRCLLGVPPEFSVALRCTGTPNPEDVAALVAISARAHCLVVDAQEAVDIRPFCMEPYTREIEVFYEASDSPEYVEDVDWRVRRNIQVFILSGYPGYVEDAIRQCGDASVPCWVMPDADDRQGPDGPDSWLWFSDANQLANSLIPGGSA